MSKDSWTTPLFPTMRAWGGRRPAWPGLAALWCGGAVLRLFGLGKQPLFLDEAWSWAVAGLPVAQIWQLPRLDPHPVLYYLLLKDFGALLPHGEAALRLLSVGASLLALMVILRLATRYGGARGGWHAGWFMMWSSWDLYYAQEARMYTLLALFWVAGYALLVAALREPRRLLAWAVVAAAGSWTHLYGLLAAGVQAGFLALWWLRQRGRAALPPNGTHQLLRSGALLVGAVVPLVWLSLGRGSQGAGGAWVPSADALPTLFALSSAGLAAARAYFLDGAHLVLPSVASLPAAGWGGLGLLLVGAPAGYGLWQGWRRGGATRQAAALAALLMVVPTWLAFGVAAWLQRPLWAFKPFLGSAYLLYLWAGVGVASLPAPWLRRAVALAVGVVAILSLAPYYTVWQKSDAAPALEPLRAQTASRIVVLEPAYLLPVARYYLGSDIPLWGVSVGAGSPALLRLPSQGIVTTAPPEVRCHEAALPDNAEVWAYGNATRIRQGWPQWPDCLRARRTWLFERGQWLPLAP